MQKPLHHATLAIALAALTFVPVASFAANPAPAAPPTRRKWLPAPMRYPWKGIR
jgi:hypothetical protein